MKHIFLILYLTLPFAVYSQTPLVHVDFNDCTAMDITGNQAAGTLGGFPICGCGISGDAMQFDGIDDFVEFDAEYTSLLQENFSFAFDFLLDNPTNPVDIVSLQRTECSKDSAFTVKYIPVTNDIQVEYSLSFGQSIRLTSKLDPSRCWNKLVFVKDDKSYLLYLNGLLVDEQSISFSINIHPESVLKIANGPCLGTTDERFRGFIDELKIYGIPLNEDQVFSLFQPIDQLLTQDTTLYLGDGVQIASTSSCATSISWSPSNGVNDVSVSTPLITPSQTEQYFISYNYGFCTASDSIFIVVVDPDDLDCSALLLPNAFTPNGDGRNDVFGISNAFIIEEFISFEIFDRWGGRVFNATTKDDVWDGSSGSISVNAGIMMYKVRYSCDGEEFTKIGSFSVIR